VSGIAGYIRLGVPRRSRENDFVAKMLFALTGAGPMSAIYSKENAFMGLGAVDALVHDVSFLQEGRISVAFKGHLTNKLDVVDGEGLRESDTTEIEIIRHLYLKYGREINQQLKGKYCFALWDAESKKMLVSTDRYGYGYLYYYLDQHWCVFATEIKAILTVLDHTPDPNINGICDIFNFHTVYENDTPFSDIYLFPHGSIAEVTKHGMRLAKYWEYNMYPKHEERN
jgi:asparagine synthetase B (glutamine-hydrolysing)